MSEQQVFQAPNLRLDHLAQAIGDWYRAQKFEVQVLPVPGEGMVVQAKQQEGWRNALGMSSTLNIGLRYTESTLVVEIGAGKWADKAVVGGVGALLVWPLFFTAAYGAWKQSNLPRQTFEFIQAFISGMAPQNPYQNPYQTRIRIRIRTRIKIRRTRHRPALLRRNPITRLRSRPRAASARIAEARFHLRRNSALAAARRLADPAMKR